MKGRRVLLAALGLACAATAQAGGVRCPPLFLHEGTKTTYYALVFVEETTAQELDRLTTRVRPLLRDIARKLGGNPPVQLELIACTHRIGGSDFDPAEMKEYVGYKVVAVFWKSQEGDNPGLVQLAVPVYLRRDGALRSDVEVVTLFDGKDANPVDSWIKVLGQDSSQYKPFVTMGLATVFRAANHHVQAWAALCESRAGLPLLAPHLLRPQLQALEREITAQLAELMREVEVAARRAGIGTLPPCAVPAP